MSEERKIWDHALWRSDSQPNHRLVMEGPPDALQLEGAARASIGYRFSSPSCTDDGVWLEWSVDRGEVTVVSSLLGFRPAFYFATGKRFGISTSILDLVNAGAPLDLDDRAISVFLRVGYFVGDDTPFLGIRAVPPNSELRWSDGKLTLTRRTPPQTFPALGMSRTAAVDAFGELFQATVNRLLERVSGKTALPLSGGRDSRHILFAMARAGRLPEHCVTVVAAEPSEDEEGIAASQLARRFQIEHTILSAPQDRVASEQIKNELTSFCADEHAWFLPMRDFLRAKDIRFAFDGIAGDILSAGLYMTHENLDLMVKGEFVRFAEHLLGADDYLKKRLKPRGQARWNRGGAVQRIAEEAARHADAPNPVAQFYFWNRTRREIALAPWGILPEPPQVFAPYLDQSVYGLLSALPASYLLDKSFHTDTISRHYPAYAGVPYASKRQGVGARRIYGRLSYLRALLPVLRTVPHSASAISPWFVVSRLAAYSVRARGAPALEDTMATVIYLLQLEAVARSANVTGDFAELGT